MPLYDYRCHKCGEVFEVRQKFSDELLKVHEGCGGEVERLISPPAFQFKGTGWYVTDYARGGSGNGKTETKPDTASKPAETKSESKPSPAPDSGSKN
jgi:putative FmdB family regulatory protein